MEEHANWLRKWHRAVVCGLPPVRDVVSKHAEYLGKFGSWFDLNSERSLLAQPVFRDLWSAHVEMHDLGRLLALKAVDGELVRATEYDAFMEKVDRFGMVARRIRDAFQRAVFDLDPLTGVHNRRSMMIELQRERERGLRTSSPVCIGLSDIDHFKKVNDTYGHGVGDVVLLTAAGRLIAHLRPYDSIYRYGGEEFLLLLPDADAETAVNIARPAAPGVERGAGQDRQRRIPGRDRVLRLCAWSMRPIRSKNRSNRPTRRCIGRSMRAQQGRSLGW